MIKYVNASWAGKGFITHDDCSKLDFECYENIVKVTGKVKDINAWVSRVGGQVIADTDALQSIKEMQIKNIDKQINEKNTEISELSSKKNNLSVG